MVETPPKGEPLKLFIEQCGWVWTIYKYHHGLFENEASQRLLEKFGHQFFSHLQLVVIEYLYIKMCALTERAKTRVGGKEIENLTLDNLLAREVWPEEILRTLEGKINRLKEITIPIRQARDKIIAHVDMETAVKNLTLGAFPDGEDEEFFRLLQEVVDIMHEQLYGGPGPFDGVAVNDVGEFIENMRISASKLSRE